MSKHTPGPWAEPCNYSATRFEIQGDRRQVAVVNKIEDARLISTAPDMLNALKDVHPFLVESKMRTYIGNLIAKAEGLAT